MHQRQAPRYSLQTAPASEHEFPPDPQSSMVILVSDDSLPVEATPESELVQIDGEGGWVVKKVRIRDSR